MTETTTTDTKAQKTKKAATPKVAKTKTAKAETRKPKRETKGKAPRESRDGWGTFALKLPVAEREAFHKATGAAGASRFARTILVAFANEDEATFKAALAEARKLRV